MEIGLTGGEEDGVDNTGADNNSLYTQPNEVFDVYQALAPISPNFSIAAAFGNVHGVYKPGNVVLRPELLGKHQEFAREQLKGKGGDQPLFLVFHGGSGSEESEIQTAVKNGVVKMNVDTDTQVRITSTEHGYQLTLYLQWAYMIGMRDYFKSKAGYLETQVGNPEGADKPNKKYYDPRVWVREGEKTMYKRAQQACRDLNNVDR